MNNLKKFSTEADYSAATLNYPAVSWVTSTDTVHFDKSAPVVANNKVKIAFTTDACGEGKRINLAPNMDVVSNIDSLTVNGEPLTPSSSDAYLDLAANTDYLIEYELKDGVTDVDNWFAITPAEGCTSTIVNYDILFPSQVDEINGLQDYITNMILESETPPNVTFNDSDITSISGIYVPNSAVNTYKSESFWTSFEDRIYPVSQYSGNIPT